MEKLLIETRNLCRKFGNQTAVNNVSLKIKEGEVYGLLGPNGAGKSTILKMLTGILRKTSGEILMEQKPWCRGNLEKIGALIETPPIYENLTARENLKVRALALGIPDQRIDEVLKKVELMDTGKKKAGKFSLGMKQRLGIAAALLNDPKLLILDEPANGLDPIGIQELRKMVRQFPMEGITVILSSHILGEVEMMADRIGILCEGVLGYEGQLPEKGGLENLFMQVAENCRKEKNRE